MDNADLLKLEALRDEALGEHERAGEKRAALARAWPDHPPEAVREVARQLGTLAGAWQRLADWAAQEIRSDAERELM